MPSAHPGGWPALCLEELPGRPDGVDVDRHGVFHPLRVSTRERDADRGLPLPGGAEDEAVPLFQTRQREA